MKKLAREIATQQAAIEKLKKDQTRLENLVASIDKRLERERAAEEATARAEEAKRAAAAQKNQKPIAPLPSGSFAQSKGRLIRRYRVESLLASAVVVQDQPFGKVFFLVLQKVPKFLPVRLDELYFRTGFAATATCSSLIMAAPTCLSTQTTNLS